MSSPDYVFPLTEDLADWFRANGRTLPLMNEYGRDLTVREIREVLDGLEGFHIEYEGSGGLLRVDILESNEPHSYVATIETFHPLDSAEDYAGPTNLCFKYGTRDIILKVVKRLSAICGPLVVYENGDRPVLITPTGEPVRLS